MAFCQISAYEGNISKRFFSSRRKTGQIHFEFNRQIYDIKMIECILYDHRFSEGYRQIWGLPALSSIKKTSIGYQMFLIWWIYNITLYWKETETWNIFCP